MGKHNYPPELMLELCCLVFPRDLFPFLRPYEASSFLEHLRKNGPHTLLFLSVLHGIAEVAFNGRVCHKVGFNGPLGPWKQSVELRPVKSRFAVIPNFCILGYPKSFTYTVLSQ